MAKSKKKSNRAPHNLPYPMPPIPNPRVRIPDIPAPVRPVSNLPKTGRAPRPLEDPINADARKGNRQALKSTSPAEELAWSTHPPWEAAFSVVVKHAVSRLEEGDLSFLECAQLFSVNRRLDRMFYKYQFACVKHLWKLFHHVGPSLDAQLRSGILQPHVVPNPSPSPQFAHNLFRVMDFVKRLTVMEGDRGKPKHVLQLMPVNCATLQILEHYRPLQQKWFCPNLVSLRWLAYSDYFLNCLLNGHWISQDLRELHLAVGGGVSAACLRKFIEELPTKYPHILGITKLTVSGAVFDDKDVSGPFTDFVRKLKGLTEFHCFEAPATSLTTIAVLKLPQIENFSWCNTYTIAYKKQTDPSAQLPAIPPLPTPGEAPQAPTDPVVSVSDLFKDHTTSYGKPARGLRSAPGQMFNSVRVLTLHAPFSDVVYLLSELPEDNKVRWLSIKTHVNDATEIEVLTALIAERIPAILHLDLNFRRTEDALFCALRALHRRQVDPTAYEWHMKAGAVSRENLLQAALQNVQRLPPEFVMDVQVFQRFLALATNPASTLTAYSLVQCFDVIRKLESRKYNPRPALPGPFRVDTVSKGLPATEESQLSTTATFEYGPQVLQDVGNQDLLDKARLWLTFLVEGQPPPPAPTTQTVQAGYRALNPWLAPWETTRPNVDPLDWRCFRPIYFCKALRDFILDVENVFDVKCSDDDLEDMGNAWFFELGPAPPIPAVPAEAADDTQDDEMGGDHENSTPDKAKPSAASSMSDTTSPPSSAPADTRETPGEGNGAKEKPAGAEGEADTVNPAAAPEASDSTSAEPPSGSPPLSEAEAKEAEAKEAEEAKIKEEEEFKKEFIFYPALPDSDINVILLKINERNPGEYYFAPPPTPQPAADDAAVGGGNAPNVADHVVAQTRDQSAWGGSGLRDRPYYPRKAPEEPIDLRFLPGCTLNGIATLTGRLRDSLREVYIPFNATEATEFTEGRTKGSKGCKPSIHLERFCVSPASRLPVIAQMGSIPKWTEETWPVAEFVLPPGWTMEMDQPNWVRINTLTSYVMPLRTAKATQYILEAHRKFEIFEAKVDMRVREREAEELRKKQALERQREEEERLQREAAKRSKKRTRENDGSSDGPTPKRPREGDPETLTTQPLTPSSDTNRSTVSPMSGASVVHNDNYTGMSTVHNDNSAGPSGVRNDIPAGSSSPSSPSRTSPSPSQSPKKRKRGDHDEVAEGIPRPQKMKKR